VRSVNRYDWRGLGRERGSSARVAEFCSQLFNSLVEILGAFFYATRRPEAPTFPLLLLLFVFVVVRIAVHRRRSGRSIL